MIECLFLLQHIPTFVVEDRHMKKEAEVVALFKAGKSQREIQVELLVSSKTVHKILKLHGLKGSDHDVESENRKRKNRILLEGIQAGKSDPEIGRDIGLSASTVGYHRRNLGLPPSMPENNYESETDRIKGYIIRNTKFMAKRRGIYFDLLYKDIELPETCPLLGIKIRYGKGDHGNAPDHYTLDRIDNNKGYINGNIIILSRLANQMKSAATFEQLRTYCKNITKLVNYMETEGALVSITDLFTDTNLLT